MAQPASIKNTDTQSVDTLYGVDGVAKLKKAIGNVIGTGLTPHEAWQGVASHQDGDTFGTNDGVVALAGVDGTTVRKLVVDSTGHLVVVASTLQSALVGTGHKNVASTGTAVVLRASTTCKTVTVKADTGNAGTIFLGINSVTNDETATTGGLQLEPGESVAFGVTDLAAVYINGTAGDGVSYLWEN